MVSVQELLKILKDKGHRQTKARVALLACLAKETRPQSVVELMDALRHQGLLLNKTTLYRELDFLKSESLVTSVRLDERLERYELNRGHHHHVVCTSCDRIEDVTLEQELQTQEKRIEKQTKFKILGHALEFFGLCADCRASTT